MSDDVGELTQRLEQLKEERDYLLVHSQNLEDELRRLAGQPARIRELEHRLAEAEARLRQVSVVSTARWLLLQPHRALRRVYRLFRQSVPWLLLKGFPGLRRRLGRFRA